MIVAPRFVLAPRKTLPIVIDMMGTTSVKPRSHQITITLVDSSGKARLTQKADLAGLKQIVLNTSAVTPSKYQLNVTVTTASGDRCGVLRQPIDFITGY